MDHQEPGAALGNSLVPTSTTDLQPEMDGIVSIPNELLLQICSYLPQSSRYHLLQTCRHMHGCVLSLLYDHDAKDDDNHALWWGCFNNSVSTVDIVFSYTPSLVDSWFKKDHCPDQVLTSWDFRKSQGAFPLSVAVSRGSVEVVRNLIERNANVHAPIMQEIGSRMNGLYPINLAMNVRPKAARKQILKVLVRNGADINQKPYQEYKRHPDGRREGEPPIFGALTLPFPSTGPYQYPDASHLKYRDEVIRSFRNQLFFLESLLRLGADPNLPGGDGQTPLMRCISLIISYKPVFTYAMRFALSQEKLDQRQIVHESILDHIKVLVHFGADVNAIAPVFEEFHPLGVGRLEISVLRLACRVPNGHEEIISYLLEQGSDINAASDQHRTPIFEFCDPAPSTTKFFRWFIKQGVNVNHQDEEGRTPLHQLCLGINLLGRNGGEEIWRYAAVLVELGADFAIRDFYGNIAEDYAARMFYPDTRKFLQKKRERRDKELNKEYLREMNRKRNAEPKNRTNNDASGVTTSEQHLQLPKIPSNRDARRKERRQHNYKGGNAGVPHASSSSDSKTQAKNKNANQAPKRSQKQKHRATDEARGTTASQQHVELPETPNTRDAHKKGGGRYNYKGKGKGKGKGKSKGPVKENKNANEDTRVPTPPLIDI